MWDFIKYCLYCCALCIAGSGGVVPEEATFEKIIVGIITWFVLTVLGAGIMWLITFIVGIFAD